MKASRAALNLSLALSFTTALSLERLAQAQITPDSTLGSEGSTVTPAALVQGELADLVEGGAIRGSNLFHSFLEFNVDAGQRVYFANPAGVESILSRVTGANPSNIFGTLGVDGAADLFLINPNGLVFGETAALDVEGSFYATTAAAIPLGDGVYSATEPAQSSLLTVSPSALFSSYLTQASGDIENRGQLAAQGDLTLAGNRLDLQGQVAAGGDLTLLGNAVQIRDTVAVPFVGFAGGDLLVQGNEQVDIVALSHPDSGLYSYGDMVLRSANPVGSDAHYFSGGSFRVENLDESLGELFSPIDPVIRALGDVEISGYLGGSLHILAGGSVNIGTAIITDADPGEIGVDFLRETITLSDGTVVEVDGGAQPTLDVRAGVSPVAVGLIPPGNVTGLDPTFLLLGFDAADGPTSADITVGDVLMAAPDGLVLLTTQYQPNTDLAKGSISVTGDGFRGFGIDARGSGGQGGSVYLDAREDIHLRRRIDASSNFGNSGNINLLASESILLQGDRSIGRRPSIRNNMSGLGQGGNIDLQADSIFLSNAFIDASTFGQGNAGRISIEANEFLTLEDGSDIFNDIANGNLNSTVEASSGGIFVAASSFILRDQSNILSFIENSRFGFGGEIKIEVDSLEMRDSSQINAVVLGQGRPGNISIYAEDTHLEGVIDPLNPGNFTSINSGLGSVLEAGNARGAAGNVYIESSQVSLSGSQITSSSFGQGNAGSITIISSGRVSFLGESLISSSISSGGIGRGGDIVIESESLFIEGGSEVISIIRGFQSIKTPSGISLLLPGQGTAGNILIDSQELISITGIGPLVNDGSFSGIATSVASGASGTGGSIEVRTTGNFFATNGAALRSTLDEGAIGSAGRITVQALNIFLDKNSAFDSFSAGNGQSGDILVRFTDRFIMGNNATIRSDNVAGIFNSGNITVRDGKFIIIDNSSISAQSLSQGNAGNIEIDISERIQVNNGVISSRAIETSGGRINVRAGSLILRENSDILTLVGFGEGSGGNIEIAADFVIALDDSDILAFSADGQGGDIDLSRTTFFGQNANIGFGSLTREELLALDGNSRVDINASGGVEPGQIAIGDSSFIENSLTSLADTIVDTSSLTAGSCIARTSNDSLGSFVATGSGGLPQRPGDSTLSTYPTGTVRAEAAPTAAVQEPDGVYQLSDGRLVLSRTCE